VSERRPSAVALVPARAGSQRVPGKNVHPLRGHPLVAYTLAAARESGLFDAAVVSTDSEEIAAVARHYGGEVPSLRPTAFATATSADIEWICHVLDELEASGRSFELFSILRPTSPFRTAATIRRAWDRLLSVPDADSVRAVELCRQHPGKMWVLDGELMRPLLPQPEGVPYHSSQYQSLPQVYVQNSSLEIAWTRVATEGGSIAGERVVPFLTEGAEGFSVDYPGDIELAERMVEREEAMLPAVSEAPFSLEIAR
jgi:CMP-N,N'-diacetyllegionaminic acid synthase